MAELAAAGTASSGDEHDIERRREAYTMALYVAICLLGALVAIGERAMQATSMCSRSCGVRPSA